MEQKQSSFFCRSVFYWDAIRMVTHEHHTLSARIPKERKKNQNLCHHFCELILCERLGATSTFCGNDLSRKWHDITWQQNIKLMFSAVTNRRPAKTGERKKQNKNNSKTENSTRAHRRRTAHKWNGISTSWFVVRCELFTSENRDRFWARGVGVEYWNGIHYCS